MKYPIVSFNAGEVTPLVDARSDVDKYRSACRILENMIARIYGPVTRRPGTKYIDTCDGVARVIPFIYSNTVAYVVLLEDLRMYFYYNGGRVNGIDGRRVKVDTPYLAADLFEIQYKQSNDVMWLVHGEYAPRQLTRTSATAFALTEITFNNGPFLKRNDLRVGDGITMAPSVTTGSGTLAASSASFVAGHVGALFAVTQPRVNVEISGSVAHPAGNTFGPLKVEGPFSFSTTGLWVGTVHLERSIDNSTWEEFKTWHSTADLNAQYTGNEEEDGVYYRIIVDPLDVLPDPTYGLHSVVRVQLAVHSSTETGVCRITGYTNPTTVSMTVLKDFASINADVRWSEGCWSAYRGFPRTVTFFEDRVVYAATDYQPQTVWFGAVDDFEDFDEGINDDDAFSLTMSTDTRCAIQWISASEALIVGTSSGEWRIRSNSFDEPVTPTNFSFKQQTTYGSAPMQALCVNDAILFVDFVRRKVREAMYDGNKDKYVAADLTALAEHITQTGIVDWAFQKNPDPILWSVLTNGTFLSMTYEREQNVIGWARHPFQTGGGVYGTNVVVTPAVPVYQYPTLQELTAAEIPTAPAEPADTPLASAISVTDKAGLQAMTPGNHYSIDADIDASGAWTPLSWNSASPIVIEGNGKTISNLTVTAPTTNYQGLIGRWQGAGGGEIRNLNFSNCAVSGQTYVGILAGSIVTTGALTIKNCNFTDCTVTATNGTSGCLAGGVYAGLDGYIYNCTVTNCTSTSASVGPIGTSLFLGSAGASETVATYGFYISDCSVVGGSITLPSRTCSNFGTFAGQLGGGGTTSTANLHLYHCTSTATIEITAPTHATNDIALVAGFVGTVLNTQLVSCECSGDITIHTSTGWTDGQDELEDLGGFAGQSLNQSEFIDCHCSGDLIFTDNGGTPELWKIGGFIGYTEGNCHFLRCYTTGALNCQTATCNLNKVGGFAGQILSGDTVVERCWCEGDLTFSGTINPVVGSSQYIGGFAGSIGTATTAGEATCVDCYAWSSILMTGAFPATAVYVGGFLGLGLYESSGAYSVENCYCAQTDIAAGSGYTGQIPVTAGAQGFGAYQGFDTGEDSVAIFYDTTTSSLSTSDIGEGHPVLWMTTKQNYVDADWDFETIWYIDPGTAETITDYSGSGLGPNSVARIPSSAEDEVWLVVYRVINGVGVRYLEQMQPRSVDDTDNLWFVDSGLALGGADADGIVSGLDHLEGEEVCVWADGAVRARQTVAGGVINTGSAILRQCIVGLPFRYKLKPMRFDLQVDGGTKGTLKRFAELVISFYESLNVYYGTDAQLAADKLFTVKLTTPATYDTAPALFTGDEVVTCEGGHSVEDPIVISGDDPCPCTVRAMVPRINVEGR